MKTTNKYAPLEQALFAHVASSPAESELLDRMPFHVDDGAEAQDAPYEPTGNAKFDAIVRASGARIKYGSAPSNSTSNPDGVDDEGYVIGDRETNWIEMPHAAQFTSPDDYIGILAHELVHWTKAKSRAKRRDHGLDPLQNMLMRMGVQLPPPGYSREEMVAEIGATLLLDSVGANPRLPERAAYVKNWESTLPPHDRARMLKAATADAERAVEWLLNRVDAPAEAGVVHAGKCDKWATEAADC